MRASNVGGRTVDEDDASAIGIAARPNPPSPAAAASAPPPVQKRRSGRNKGAASGSKDTGKTTSQTSGAKRLISVVQAAERASLSDVTSEKFTPTKSPATKRPANFDFSASKTVQRVIQY
jgi:hypothetical protein